MMERPVFRHDLVSQPIDQSGHRFVDVSDPGTGQSFRFYEVEYAVACAMDGQRDVAGLITWAHDEMGLKTSENEIAEVVSCLARLGYLEGATKSTAAGTDPAAERPKEAAPPQTPPAAARADLDFALGAAGSTPAAKAAPSAPDIELGAAGPKDEPPPTPAAPDAQTLVEPAPTDVSVDLSQHLSSPVGEPLPAEDPPIEPLEEELGSQPISIPEEPFIEARKSVPAPKKAASGTSSAPAKVIVSGFLVALLVAAGIFGYYKFVVEPEQAAEDASATAEGQIAVETAPAVAADVTPTGPAAPVASKTFEDVVTAPEALRVVWVAQKDAPITEGSIVVKFKGYNRAELSVSTAKDALDSARTSLAETPEDKANRRARFEKEIEKQTAAIQGAAEQLKALSALSPSSGTFVPAVSAGQTVEKGATIAKIVSAPAKVATFEVADASQYSAGAVAKVTPADAPKTTITCEVRGTTEKQVTVACPADQLEEGVTVHLQ